MLRHVIHPVLAFVILLVSAVAVSAASPDPDRDPFNTRLIAAEQALAKLSTMPMFKSGGEFKPGDPDRLMPFDRIKMIEEMAMKFAKMAGIDQEPVFLGDPDRNLYQKAPNDPLMQLMKVEKMIQELEAKMAK